MTMDPVILKQACLKVLDGFEKEVFVRNTKNDRRAMWAVEVLPYLQALSVLDEYSEFTKSKHES